MDKYVGADEKGVKVNCGKYWMWIWQNVKNTFLKASDNRDFDTIQKLFPKSLINTVIGATFFSSSSNRFSVFGPPTKSFISSSYLQRTFSSNPYLSKVND